VAKSITQVALVAEIAAATNQSKRAVGRTLKALSTIAYREAKNGFTIPGICKLKVVHKPATTCRNPATGQRLQIGERDVLKVVPLKKAKDAITPRPDDLVQVLQEPPSSPAPPPPEALPPPSNEMDAQGQIIFACPECNGMIGAPDHTAGDVADCPFCGASINIPKQDQPRAADQEDPSEPSDRAEEFVTFICATCNQEIEAPADIIGMEVSCPACASSLHVPTATPPPEPEAVGQSSATAPPVDRSSMTLRIDLSDLA
jgi:DNA-binding protein HU-beta